MRRRFSGELAISSMAAARPSTRPSSDTGSHKDPAVGIEIVERAAPGRRDDRLAERHRLEHHRAAALEQAGQDQAVGARSIAPCSPAATASRQTVSSPAPSPRRRLPARTARAPTAAGTRARRRRRGSRAASAHCARGGESLQQELDALPADEAAHEHEGDDVIPDAVAPSPTSTARGRRRSRPARRRGLRSERPARRGSGRSRPEASPPVACPASAR